MHLSDTALDNFEMLANALDAQAEILEKQSQVMRSEASLIRKTLQLEALRDTVINT